MKTIAHFSLVMAASVFLALLLIVHLFFNFGALILEVCRLSSFAKFFIEVDDEIFALYKQVISFVDRTVMGK
jgi:hypothetical protein